MTLGRTLQGIKGWASSYPAMKAKREAQAQEQLDVENAGTIGGDAADNSGSGSGTASAPFEHSAYDLAARGGNYDLAFSLSSVAAADGDPCAAFLLGVMYYEGKGVDVDCEKACSLFADAYVTCLYVFVELYLRRVFSFLSLFFSFSFFLVRLISFCSSKNIHS